MPVAEHDPVAAEPDHPLDERLVGPLGGWACARLRRAGPGAVGAAHGRVGVGARWRVEDDDVAQLRLRAEPVADPVDEHAVADLERRLHRRARDPVRLDRVRLDRERERPRDRHEEDQLEQRAPA
jgi:hypothetical protein